MSTNLEPLENIIGTRCISYYASDKSALDGKHSYEFWTRSKLTRIVCNKPFGRGDTLQIDDVKETPSGILIETILINEWEQGYPVLNFISGRLIYNKWADFECTPTEGIQIVKQIEQILADNYSIGFVILAYKSGKISCVDKVTNNKFDIHIRLDWE
nr:MAG TPA: hypothetical protein [Caudoviricetes sp.]